MKYIISDIHGCYKEYKELIKKLNLSEEQDQLYILGDTLDRGPEPIKVLKEFMVQPNVTYIIGNHDYLFLYFARKLGTDFLKTQNFSKEDIADFRAYLSDGGLTTVEQFMQLPADEKKAVCEYLENASVYEVIEESGKRYVLVHAGIANFKDDVPLESYDFLDFICERTDYKKRYYQDENTFVITGHTPTMYIHPDFSAKVFVGNGHIAIDCGCVYGGELAAYCVETGEAVYVKSCQ